MLSPIYIDVQTPADPTILVATDPGFTQDLVVLSKASIINVSGVFVQNAGSTYPYNTKTILNVMMDHGRDFKMELQRVANQPTWNLGTNAALNVAISDINASL